MKCKLDFVTNSSSVSVVMWGIYLDMGEVRENEILMEKVKEFVTKDGREFLGEEEDLSDDLHQMVEDMDLNIHFDYNGDGVYVGKSPFDISENETAGEFKNRLKEKLKSIGVDRELQRVEESWYDS